jgi:hypothetical protein
VPKFSINATELTDTDVNFVALVKRGANRLPFRITKGDEPMLDLYKLARTAFKKADPVAMICAVVVQKGANLALIDGALMTVGIDVATFARSEKGGLITATRKSEDAPEDVMLVKLDKDVMLAVSCLKKGFNGYDFNSSDFGEVHATGAFCSSASTASDMLQMTIANILCECEAPDEALAKISKACEDFTQYMTVLTSALPVQAFKADVALRKANAADPFPAKKHPHAGVALAIAHAAHAAAAAAGHAGAMISADSDATATGGANDSLPVEAGKAAHSAKKRDGNAAGEALAVEKANKVGAVKAAAGDNGTGAGFKAGAGTATNAKATADDATNTAVEANNRARVSGAKKAERNSFVADSDGDGDDDTEMSGAVPADEESAGSAGESDAATSRASADDKKMKINGGTDGSTLPAGKEGIPAKLIAKNDGDADIGKKGRGKTEDDDLSGAGAQAKEGQAMKSGDPVMRAIAALSKTVAESLSTMTQDVGALAARVDAVGMLARKTDAALNGTVFNEATGDAAGKIQKAEGRSGSIPLMDTGYSRRSA